MREEKRAASRFTGAIRERSARVLGRQDERNVIYVREHEVYLKLRGIGGNTVTVAYLRFWRASAARAD